MFIRIAVVVGEPSGDRLGAHLAMALRAKYPTIQIEGVIGSEMIRAGCLQLASMDILAVMGIIDPLMRIRQILKMRKWLLRYFLEDPPDLFIGIDAPDFNLGVEKVLHKAGIPTVHYVSPSVWAWRRGRIKTIQKSVDLMLTLFPFEAEFYKQHQVPVCYTGHPTADIVPVIIDKKLAKQALGYAADDQVLAVLPGSRNGELKHLVKIYLETIKALHANKPELKFIMPLLYRGHQEFVEFWRQKIVPNIELKYVIDDSYAVMSAADFALVTSGTATLEMMLHNAPMVVAFRTNRITFEIVKRMVKVKFIALPNLLADDLIVPECIQEMANPDNLALVLTGLIDSTEQQDKQRNVFRRLHQELKLDASNQAADAIAKLLKLE